MYICIYIYSCCFWRGQAPLPKSRATLLLPSEQPRKGIATAARRGKSFDFC